MDWVIGDSEDEEEHNTISRPTEETQSIISEFSSRDISLPAANETSPISNFTASNIVNTSFGQGSILIPSTSAPAPPRPKRPKPRPAYKGSAAGTSPAAQSTTTASVIASAINQTRPRSPHDSVPDTTFSLDISERTKTRKRKANSDYLKSTDQTIRSSSGIRHSGTALEGSSNDIICISSDIEQETTTDKQKTPQLPRISLDLRNTGPSHASDRSVYQPSDLDSSILHTPRASTPSLDCQPVDPNTSSPSLPTRPKKLKKREAHEESGYSDGTDDPSLLKRDAETNGTKRKRTDKTSRPSKAKKVPVDTDSAPLAALPAKVRKRQPKPKQKALEQEFKSKEFIEESDDDDLLLIPQASRSALGPNLSDPVSLEMSAQASIDVSIEPSAFVPTEPAHVTDSLLPSQATSVRVSTVSSDPPSADLSAPPPSPSVQITSRDDKIIPKKRRKKNNIPTDPHPVTAAEMNLRDSGSLESKNSDNKGKGKTQKKAEVALLLDTAGKTNTSPVLDELKSAKQAVPSTDGARSEKQRHRKKKGTVISSDEDEPYSDSLKGSQKVMDVEKTNQGRSADKENEVLPSPTVRLEYISEPSPSASGFETQKRSSEMKSRTSTPHKPSRRDSMSALIRRVSSKVQSPLSTPSSACLHSPLAKASRAALSRIAPLHPNRRPPPPAPPRPPAPKKSKKMLELEEKWEMELAETVEGWSCLGDDERAALRRAKRDAELGYDD